ncbi:alpha/beta hydrolase [Pelagibius litoralis]|uniref:Alpha/beta hydrolase n=1 Tax=Pelagibius litoralis TaxID=374515 RepID=A0A967F0C0_9PROT|nr:alpha/beta hydrolase [Pelagibius litoralis]NIA70803.1 alpha/beta hydrolase [Pelagibius litoralis]
MRRHSLRTLLSCSSLVALLTACSGTDLLNGLTPREGYGLEAGIAYGPDDRHRLDLYAPESGEPEAMVLFFYGGSWESGERGDYRFVGEAFASQGLAVAIPDYRLYPPVRYPAFLEDSAAAVAWAHRHHKGPLFLVGHSAGAYNAVMLALDDRLLAAEGLRPCDTLAGVVGLAGPYDFLPLTDPALKAIFGPAAGRAATQPVAYVNPKAPPLLLLSGDADTVVRPRNSRILAERQRAAGGKAEARFYDDLGHLRIVGALSRPLRAAAPVLDDIRRFIDTEGSAIQSGC